MIIKQLSKKGRFSFIKPSMRPILLLFIIGVILLFAFLFGYYSKSLYRIYIPKKTYFRYSEAYKYPTNYIKGLLSKPEKLSLEIGHVNFQKLAYQRDLGMKLGEPFRLHPNNMQYVKCKVKFDNETFKKSRIRLKGWGPDHWAYLKKWSFKIKLPEGETIKGMNKFAVQHPRSRNYLNEWFYSRMLTNNGLLNSHYDFVKFEINGENYGIYALEEAMEKDLLIRNGRKEGPIFILDTDLVHLYYYSPIYGEYNLIASFIPYQKSKLLESDSLKSQFEHATILLEQFKNQEISASKIFDVDMFAMVLAISDLFGHFHGVSWHNLKLYYNPETGLIEPIGFDQSEIKDLSIDGLLGFERKLKLKDQQIIERNDIQNLLFSDTVLFKKYIEALEKVSEKKFLDSMFNKVDDEMEDVLSFIHKDFPMYTFENSKEILFNNQKVIQSVLSAPFKGIQVYFDNFNKDSSFLELQVSNVSKLPVQLLKIEIDDENIVDFKHSPIMQPYIEQSSLEYKKYRIYIPKSDNFNNKSFKNAKLIYSVFGCERQVQAEIYPWSYPNFIRENINKNVSNINEFSFWNIDEINKTITFKNGKHIISENIIIPKGYLLFCNNSTTIDLIDSASIISYSACRFIGKEKNKIRIISSDSTGLGLFVNSNFKKSIFKNVEFKNLLGFSNLEDNVLSALTFSKSVVDISDCSFIRNNYKTSFINIFSSQTVIQNTTFNKIFDNAITISDSNCKILNCTFDNVRDKAIVISQSELLIEKSAFKNTNIGLFIKDKSIVDMSNVNYSLTTTPFLQNEHSFVSIDGKQVANDRLHNSKLN